MTKLKTNHGTLSLPAFLPDATYGSIKNVSFDDLNKTGIQGIVTTTLHIENKIGSEYVKKYGGIHKFFGYDKPVLTDSGGWQVYSLINQKNASKDNKITQLGASFRNPTNGDYTLLSPESSIQIQYNLKPDIMTVLDNPFDPEIDWDKRKENLRINKDWAERSKRQYLKLTDLNVSSFTKITDRPLLGAVIQGGENFDLREQSAKDLLDIGFDMYNFGGVPLMSKISWKNEQPSGLHKELLHKVSEMLPNDKIKYAMGIGQPEDIAFCVEIGWNLFDTVLPTRNARHGYLYVSENNGDTQKKYKEFEYDVLHLRSERYKFDDESVDPKCDCEACTSVSRAYVRHLIRIKEPAGLRLATIHNLRFYSKWMERLRQLKVKG